METILFLAHTDSEGKLPKAALDALTGAVNLAEALGGATLSAGLIGTDVQNAANSIAGCGAVKFFAVADPALGQARYATDAAAAEALCKASGATLVIAPGSSRLSRVMSGVAHRLGGRVDTHVTGVGAEGGAPVATRWYYRQRMRANLTRTQRPWVLTLDAGSQPTWSGEAGTATLEPVAVDLPATRTEVTGTQSPAADQQTIRPEAELLFVAGAGWTKKQKDGQTHVKDAEGLIKDFIDTAKASLGSSKSLTDQASEGGDVLTILTHLNQIGQTGATPRHPKGLATCCHGEEPHVVGWRFINERRAVNLDANCGWARGKADVLYVADAFEVMQKVNALLAE